MMDIKKGSAEEIVQWLALAEKEKSCFPGLETEEGLRQFRDSVLAHMERGGALEACEAGRLAGMLLFDREGRTLDFLAVEREHRRKGIGRALCLKALEEMPEGGYCGDHPSAGSGKRTCGPGVLSVARF